MKTCEWCSMPCDDAKLRDLRESEAAVVCDSCYASELATRSISKRESAMIEVTTDQYLGEYYAIETERRQKERENAQWLRFAEAAISGIMSDEGSSENSERAERFIANCAANVADAMLTEARQRGRV